jgi:ABC-type Na+ efflux pump permease subunit
MCKTFKTAQSALGGVSMFFTFPVMFLDAMDVKLSAETAAIPVIGHALLMRRVVRGESVPLEDLGLSVLTTLLLAVAAFLVARRLLGERITAGND